MIQHRSWFYSIEWSFLQIHFSSAEGTRGKLFQGFSQRSGLSWLDSIAISSCISWIMWLTVGDGHRRSPLPLPHRQSREALRPPRRLCIHRSSGFLHDWSWGWTLGLCWCEFWGMSYQHYMVCSNLWGSRVFVIVIPLLDDAQHVPGWGWRSAELLTRMHCWEAGRVHVEALAGRTAEGCSHAQYICF